MALIPPTDSYDPRYPPTDILPMYQMDTDDYDEDEEEGDDE
jgi:hypothetical protein